MRGKEWRGVEEEGRVRYDGEWGRKTMSVRWEIEDEAGEGMVWSGGRCPSPTVSSR